MAETNISRKTPTKKTDNNIESNQPSKPCSSKSNSVDPTTEVNGHTKFNGIKSRNGAKASSTTTPNTLNQDENKTSSVISLGSQSLTTSTETSSEAEERRKKIAAAARAFALAPSPTSLPKRKSTKGKRSSKKSLQMSSPLSSTPAHMYNRNNRMPIQYNPSMIARAQATVAAGYSNYSPTSLTPLNNRKKQLTQSISKRQTSKLPLHETSNLAHQNQSPLDTNTRLVKDTNGDEDEDEYAKFVRSLCDTSDLASIISFPVPDDDDDDEASYQLPDDDEDEDDFDEFFDSHSIFSNLDIDIKEAERLENDNLTADHAENEQSQYATLSGNKEKKSTLKNLVEKSKIVHDKASMSHTSNFHSDDVKKSDEIKYNELKEELGNLMEEDIEASLATLLQQPIHPNPSSMSPSKRKVPQSTLSQINVSTPDKTKTMHLPSNNYYAAMAVSPFASQTNKTSASPSMARHRKQKVFAAAARATSTILPSSKLEPLTPTIKFENIRTLPDSEPHYDSNNSISQTNSMNLPLTPSSQSSSRQTPYSDKSVTIKHISQLHSLMNQHYQLLLQQSILAVRTAHQVKKEKEKSKATKDKKCSKKPSEKGSKETPKKRSITAVCGETQDEIKEILEGAVVMLQDLDQNRKDSIRNSIAQIEQNNTTSLQSESQQRLTRSAFMKSLLERDCLFAYPSPSPLVWKGSSFVKRSFESSQKSISIFDVKGLGRLNETFSTLDNSVNCNGKVNIMEMTTHSDACSFLLKQAGADIDPKLIPGKRDLSTLLTFPKECLGSQFNVPLSDEKQLELRQNRDQFTASEDNLLLRGVNLFGEKEWLLVSERFLPDRSLTFISHRYSKLCFLLYIAHGIFIDEEGNLETPPEHPEGVENFDEEAILKVKAVEEPYKYNVHRWSFDEDITILRLVPLMGRMWAEMSNRLIKHRNRGHIRKRYQVLERRVKGAIKRNKDIDIKSLLSMSPKNGNKSMNITPSLASGGSDTYSCTTDMRKNGNLIKSSTKKRQNIVTNQSVSDNYDPMTKKSKTLQSRPIVSEYSRLPPKMLPMMRTGMIPSGTNTLSSVNKEGESSKVYDQVVSSHTMMPNTPGADTIHSSRTKDTPNVINRGKGRVISRYCSADNLGIQRRFVMTPSKEAKSPITILSSRSPYTPSNISAQNIEGEEELICDENMESLPADSSLMEINSKVFSTPSSINTLSNLEKKSKPVKRSLQCSPQESTSQSLSSTGLDKILQRDYNDISNISGLNTSIDNTSLAPKFKSESRSMNEGLTSGSRNVSLGMLEKLPYLSTDISSFSILNMSKDVSKFNTKETISNLGTSQGKLEPRKPLFSNLGVKEKDNKTKEKDPNPHIPRDLDNNSNIKEMEAPLGDVSALSFSRLGNDTKDMMQITGTATQLIAGETSIGGLSDFGITNLKFSEASMNAIEGKNNASRQPTSTDSATSTTITEHSMSAAKNPHNSQVQQRTYAMSDANAASALSSLQSRALLDAKSPPEMNKKRERKDSKISFFEKVTKLADGRSSKKQRK